MVNIFNSPQFMFNTKEIEVLIYTAMGLTFEETARKTFKWPRNISFIRASIRRKLKAKNFNHAITPFNKK